ncbi:MAG: family 78 glycoside hydrolase catalytic domain, partial [Clostridia bacterium]|nr:family 78 glycoside hydrolase catalytic domain [Clostridia bacterium]
MCKSTDIQHDWGGAKFIKATDKAPDFSYHDPLPLFRREFTVEEPVAHAELLVQAPGFGKLYINGRDVTDDIFISATSDYDKILWYNTCDVTALLQKGKNVLAAIAGNGFLNESFRTAWDFDTAPWRDAPKLLLCLKINGKPFLVSDETFRVSRDHSHITFSHIRSGEYVDMRKYDTAWQQTDFDDSAWLSAVTADLPPHAALHPTPCQPIREHERFSPIAVNTAEDGAYLVDFGITISGYAEVTLQAPRGTEIDFYYAEELDEAGYPKHNGMDDKHFYKNTPFQKNRLIASGGVDTFKPLFSYHGFRYLRIKGLMDPPDISNITAIFTHQAVARRADFTSDNAVLNYIYRAGIHSSYANMFWSMTDCPTREKLGWMNDAQASTAQLLINFDILPLFQKWFEDMKVSQFPDGSLHGTVPSPDWPWGHACGPVCDLMLFELPYRSYLYTGDAAMLQEGLPYFKRYIAFLEGALAAGREFELGDWKSNAGSRAVPKRMIAELHLLKALDITAFADRLAETGDILYEQKATALRAELATSYLDDKGRAIVAQQTAIAMLMMLHVGEEAMLGTQLVERVLADGCQLRAGMVGIQYIYDALSRAGRPDLAFRLLTETKPGYRTWYEHGETSLWEEWNGENSGSHNHHMYSGVIAWFFHSLLGLTPREDVFPINSILISQ